MRCSDLWQTMVEKLKRKRYFPALQRGVQVHPLVRLSTTSVALCDQLTPAWERLIVMSLSRFLC